MDDVKNDTPGEGDAERVKRMSLEDVYDEYCGYIKKICGKFCSEWRGHPFINSDFQEDLVAETFSRLLRAHQLYDGKSKFTTYLYRIIYNAFIDMVNMESGHHGMVGRDGLSMSDQVKMRNLGGDPDAVGGGRAEASFRVSVGEIEPETVADPSPGPGEEGVDLEVLAAIDAIMKPCREGGEPGAEAALSGEAARILREGIREIEKPVRVAVATMYFIERIPQTAVARNLNRSQSAVSDQVNLARRHLLDYIARRFPDAGDLVAKIKRLAADGGGKDG
ncbi:MAG: sigma-70 family RNA polymerase sigma factor [Spirochaetes bacterium]|nr:sigma-70 family RNA polymerase sigma factor [Spirochaetota bacterium]